ncbi:hypothetical protein F4553_003278 [Allocatelliglobosispora scoriae]|uniref:Uncharacterized protein n=1 Tax=Allocatelliglobosispora scoriae TaxID=643052 RepID=A0A841BRS3_9ACTN|nr:hypothetical protein [Allocatelliglobosispora scoriae]MBB5869899.1 hypothetical protein [Allocatelliglobosispora scoriae]
MTATWRSLPAATRAEARSLAARGLPHPDPAVQAAVAARHARLADSFARTRLIASFSTLLVLPWSFLIEVSTTTLLIMLGQFLVVLALTIAQPIGQLRYLASGRLSAPNIYALAWAAAADRPAQPREFGRPRRRFVMWLTISGSPVIIGAALTVAIVVGLVRGDWPGWLLGALALVLVLIAMLILWGWRLTRRMDPRVAVRLTASGIHLPDNPLTLAWSEVVRVHAAPQAPAPWRGIAGLAILLRDPEAVGARLPGRLVRGVSRWAMRRQHGWVVVQDTMLGAPVAEVVAAAMALHRAALAEQQTAGTRQAPAV